MPSSLLLRKISLIMTQRVVLINLIFVKKDFLSVALRRAFFLCDLFPLRLVNSLFLLCKKPFC